MKAGIVEIKPAIEALKGTILGIKQDRSDKSRSAIAASMKQVGQIRQRRIQWRSQLARTMYLRIGTSQNGGRRGNGERRLRVCLTKNQALSRDAIKIMS